MNTLTLLLATVALVVGGGAGLWACWWLLRQLTEMRAQAEKMRKVAAEQYSRLRRQLEQLQLEVTALQNSQQVSDSPSTARSNKFERMAAAQELLDAASEADSSPRRLDERPDFADTQPAALGPMPIQLGAKI